MSNEAAERLRDVLAHDGTLIPLPEPDEAGFIAYSMVKALDTALAAERRATVEPAVRAALRYVDHHTPLAVGEPLVQRCIEAARRAILDEEAAR